MIFSNYSALPWLRAPASGFFRQRMSAARWRSLPRLNNYDFHHQQLSAFISGFL
jgi:hypothetical protein